MTGDVFGGPGGLGDLPQMPSAGRRPDLDAFEALLEGAALWGLELDPKFRVLAATVEPVAERYPWGQTDDRRLQVLCFPVSTILASLRRDDGDDRAALSFGEDQLVDVVAALGGAPVHGPVFNRPEPRPGQWGPRFSLQGRSSAPDGTTTTITLSLQREDLAFDLFARFDDIRLRGPDGSDLSLPTPS